MANGGSHIGEWTGPPAGWPSHHQLLWLQSDDDCLDEYLDELQERGRLPSMGIGWASRHDGQANDHARLAMCEPECPESLPSAGCSGSPVSDVNEPGADGTGLV